MSNFLKRQMQEIVDARMGTSASRVVIGIVTNIGTTGEEKQTCTVCPIDVDALWDMKMFYGRTKIDRTTLQGSIQRVSYSTSASIIDNTLSIGDKVSVGYNEDKPYIIQKIGTSYSRKTLATDIADSETYEWLDSENSKFGAYTQESPIPTLVEE